MIRYQCNPPALIKLLFNNFKWNSSSGKILLTFDDGPIPETTELILKLLDNHKIKSLFFCVGNNVLKNPGLTNSILAEGHLIGNHTFNHKKITKVSAEDLNNEINLFNKLLEDKHGYAVKYFRPPHGRFNLYGAKIIKQQNMINVMWSLLTYDFKSDLKIYKKIVNRYLKSNSIAVLHDSLKSKPIIEESIEYLVEAAYKKGFSIGEPSECLK